MASDDQLIHENPKEAAICFSHLRWDFVFQRPQHLMTRLSAAMALFFWEEPVFHAGGEIELELIPRSGNLTVVRLAVPEGMEEHVLRDLQKKYLDDLIAARGIEPGILWYYSPMMFSFSDHLRADLVIYDCMDELSAFRGAPPGLKREEARLMARADLVFTGGHSLYEAKRSQHSHIHPFPSSVDAAHFQTARGPLADPEDQRAIPYPRLGFYGVIDERFDVKLLDSIAGARPAWHFVMLGPVVKISPEDLPRRPNIHSLGSKTYEVLPAYLSGWDAALMPFALNEATRFISPTKLPEYLAAGRAVVSTPIVDVVHQYGHLAGVRIAADANAFVAAIEQVLNLNAREGNWLSGADQVLTGMSWDKTWAGMSTLIASKRPVR